MAKETKKIKKPEAPKKPSKSSVSDIDDIFSGVTTKLTPPITKVEEPASKNAKRKAKKKALTEAENTKEEMEEIEESKEEEILTEAQEHKVEQIIFAELAAAKSLKKRQAPPMPVAMEQEDDGFGDSRGKKGKRLTDDGYPLYDVGDKHLRLGQGLDTPECPFDCSCCY
ncbi:hypothetical protein BDF14DRAFT_1862835 [Spinellus fusiger]|nr:hypothetical protein BDF14DRAFT_1862835 [Spinellus fusiger]